MSKKTLPISKDLDQLDLFVADLIDVPVKGEMTTMEYPIFALSTKPDTEIYRYENPNNGSWLEVIPSAVGRATIFDKDIVIYCISQIREAMNRGKTPSRRVHITAYDYLKAVGKSTSGRDYKNIQDTLTRLRGTTFKSNVFSSDGESEAGRVFGLVDDAKILSVKGRMTSIEIVLGEAIFEAISNKRVLTYNRDYFNLRSPNERRLYELCRKHCGSQPIWSIKLDNLHAKFGGRSNLREFRRMIRKIVDAQSIPDYAVDYEAANKAEGTNEKLVVISDKAGLTKEAYLAGE